MVTHLSEVHVALKLGVGAAEETWLRTAPPLQHNSAPAAQVRDGP